MIKGRLLTGLLILSVAMLSCTLTPQTSTVAIPESPALAAIDLPKDGDVIQQAPYEIVYHGSDLTEVTQLELAVNSVPVTILPNPAPGTGFVLMRYVWTPPAPGNYLLQTRAQNQKGEWGPYSYVTVIVEPSTSTVTINPTVESTVDPSIPTIDIPMPTESLPTMNVGGEGIITSLIKSTQKFYYGSESCGSHTINFSVGINNPAGIRYVYIFVRLDDKDSGKFTDWDDGKHMTNTGTGYYHVTIDSMADIPYYASYEKAWLGYQIVVQQPDGTLVRSPVYYDVTLEHCP
ncbi:MAG: hypothetical protein JW704_07765 [Anaerolineaceae bacterium]|nr:hypothetical protein [Anaerolineaceae bacterium]MBN2677109.1 hypothetical protein [Anaerolineaceae bacterium]